MTGSDTVFIVAFCTVSDCSCCAFSIGREPVHHDGLYFDITVTGEFVQCPTVHVALSLLAGSLCIMMVCTLISLLLETLCSVKLFILCFVIVGGKFIKRTLQY